MPQPCCDDEPVSALAADLLGCLTDALASCNAPACRTSLVPGGEAVWDVCCQCCDEDGNPADGQAWVRVESVFPSQMLPVPDMDPATCATGWAATFELGVVRCVSTMEEDGSPPCAADLNADARKLMRDASLMRQAVTCCFGPDRDPGTWLVGAWTPLGPQGGCAGGRLTVTVSFRQPYCLPDAE